MRAARSTALGGVLTVALLAAVGLVAALFLAVGCGDDGPVSPKVSPWTEVPLPDNFLGFGGLLGIAFHGDHGLAVGLLDAAITGPLVLETSGGSWTRVTIPALSSTMFPVSVTFTSAGEAILGGTDIQSSIVTLLDERNGWSAVNFSTHGGIQNFAEGDGILRGVGTSLQGLSLVSTAADVWTADGAGFVTTQANDKGLVDVTWHDGIFYACGFDDAADGSPQEPSNVVVQNDGTGWTRIESPVEDGAFELRAIAVTGDGIVLVGGAITDFSAGASDQYVATLVARGTDGTWTPVSLPDPGTLDEVQDILVTSAGDIVLACGISRIHFVKGSLDTGLADEGPGSRGQIRHLAEDSTGAVFGCGSSFIDEGDVQVPTPLLLKREP